MKGQAAGARAGHAPFMALPAVMLVIFATLVPVSFALVKGVAGLVDGEAGGALARLGALLEDDALRDALGRQASLAALALAIQIPLGLALAAASPRRGRAAAIYLVLLATPLIVPWSALGVAWRLYAEAGGPFAVAAGLALGAPFDPHGDADQAWIALLAMEIWRGTPMAAILFAAGLGAVDPERLRVAACDGASFFAIFRHVRWPHLRLPFAIFVLLRAIDVIALDAEAASFGAPTLSTALGARLANEPALAGALAVVVFPLLWALAFLFHALCRSLAGGARP